jgi:UDP-glucuronate 4-epimerase
MTEQRKVLVTGATGRLGMPVCLSLAQDHEVWGAARFADQEGRERLEAGGVRTFRWDMTGGSLDGLPRDFTHVLHGALHADHDDFEGSVAVACRSAGMVMEHCRAARSFLFVSSSAVYSRLEPGHLHRETDPLGGTSTPAWGPAYAVSKLSAEGATRALSVALGLPATIARLSVQYGGTGGAFRGRGGMPGRFHRLITSGRPVPVRPSADDYCSPLHIDDIVRQVPLLWAVAAVPATVVNWGGDQAVSIRELTKLISDLAGLPVKLEKTDQAAGMVALDPGRRRDLIGYCTVDWRDGIDRLVAEQSRR